MRRAASFLFGNWYSRGYLLAVVAVTVYVAISLATWDQPDANLVGVWLLFVTLPGSLLGLAAPEGAWFAVSIVFGALLNAAAISALVHLVRRRRT